MRVQLLASIVLSFLSSLAPVAVADEPQSQLGKRGKQLLSEKFDGKEPGKNWKTNTGKMVLQDGSLRISELAADKHVGAFRYALPMQDMLVSLDFQFDGARTFHLGFDPAPGQLSKKGHLYNVVISPSRWSLVEANDKAQSDSKPKAHAQESISLQPKKWYTLTLENKGEEVLVTIKDIGTLRVKASDFKVKKPAIILRAAGEDSSAVLIDNLSVYEIE